MAKTAKPTTKKKKLSADEKAKIKKERNQKKEIQLTLKNIGFHRLNYIDGKQFTYKGRTSEIDDVFICENIILLTEYTTGDPSSHLAKKSLIYNNINESHKDFIDFMLGDQGYNSFRKYYEDNIKDKYSKSQLKIRILYCSQQNVNQEYKDGVNCVSFFDYNVVQYFKSLSKIIKQSSRYEFLEFIDIPFRDFAENILGSGNTSIDKFSGHILPEAKSSFEDGYKIVSFYIDAASLIKRSYVLRQEGWRDTEGIGHYQRMFVPNKISNMRRYLVEKKRVFINNIITTISESDIRLLDQDGQYITINEKGEFEADTLSLRVTPTMIEINDSCNIVGVIDGQHRVYAYHEGDDVYETKIKELRKIQNLLVTGIIFPKKENAQARRKFEANLFLEINSNQNKITSKLQQDIQLMIIPFSNIAIGKRILKSLNQNGALRDKIEQFSYENGKIKTASIVSFGLKPLIKFEEVKTKDSLHCIWDNIIKNELKLGNNYDLLDEYKGHETKRIFIEYQ